MDFATLGLKRVAGPATDHTYYEGKVEGIGVHFHHTPGFEAHPDGFTELIINTTRNVYTGFLTADEVANFVVEYVDNRFAEVGDSYAKWRERYAAVHRRFGAPAR